MSPSDSALGWALRVSVLLLLAMQLEAHLTCGPGLNTPGVTIPQGDIILQDGDTLELYCILNLTHPATKGRNASHLAFYRLEDKKISQEHLQIMNETTLRLSMKAKVSSSMYYCKLSAVDEAEEESVCLNNVAVGYPPQEVTDFSCVSYNWQNLTCSWKKKYNPVKTQYLIWFRLPGRAGNRVKYGCPDDSDAREDRCVWNETSNPHYRQPYEFYLFSLEGSNYFNRSVLTLHRFHHYAHVIPAKAENLKLKEKTSYSAFVAWTVPYPMQNFPPGLIQRVEYLPQWESRDSWHKADMSSINLKDSEHELNITGLKYANTLYDIRVYMKSAKANLKDNSLWSAPAAITIKTRPDLPGAPPKTDIGSFEVYNHVDSRDVYIYWQTIPDHMQNGDMFSYRIIAVEENGKSVVKETTELTKKHAKYSKIDLNKSLRLWIASVNSEGQSINKSEIFIPGRHHVPPGPASVTKVFYENGTYELSWKPPGTSQEKIESYTIFWCDSIYDHMCSGYLNWTRVPSNVTIKNMTVEDDKPYQFAVSANSHNASSGMVWASCTILYNKPIQKMKNVWVKKVGSTYMELVWNLDCLDRNGLVDGFRIYYCPVQHKGPECKSPNQNVTVFGAQSTTRLTGLRPYTTYSISIAVLSSGGESLPSDPLLNVTLEAAPSTPPQNVTILNVTNTTITVTWNAPEERNGVITKYEVYYDGKVQTKNMEPNVDVKKKQELMLTNLTSYFNYSISVAACTVACSDKSPPMTAETKVGEPGSINAPHVTFVNSSQLSVTWDPPARPSGLLDYYEVKRPGYDNSSVVQTTNTSIQVRIEECSENQDQPYSFSVRAVNVDPISGKTFNGEWSPAGEGSCYQSGIPQYLKIVIYCLGVTMSCAVIFFMICVGRRVWFTCKDMRDVEVKLPPGIVSPLDHQRDQDFKMHQWTLANHDSEPPHSMCPAADEERLLQQKDDHHERNLSGDSSGCSSGHESVSSSTTSGTHISADSGTEVDQNEHDPSWEAGSESGSLRQRQVVSRPSWDESYHCVGGKGVRSTPNLTELEPSYTVVAHTNWPSSSSIPDKIEKTPVSVVQIQQSSRGYVPLDAASSIPTTAMPPLVHAKHDVSPGYVAHPPSNLWAPTVPVKGYVTTGEKSVFSPECDSDWKEPFNAELQRLKSNSGGYVKAGECGLRPSRTEPTLGSGYVITGETALRRDRHKLEHVMPVLQQQTVPPVERHKSASHGVTPRTHEYVVTGERELSQSPPLLLLGSDPDPSKAYCRVSERDTSLIRPIPASSGYVPHRQLETPSVVE